MISSEFALSFTASGIFANLCCDGENCFSNASIDFHTILNELVSSPKFQSSLSPNFQALNFVINQGKYCL